MLRVLLAAGILASGVAGVHAEPDEQALGKARGYPVGDASSFYLEPFRVGSWSALDEVPGLRTRGVPAARSPLPLAREPQPPPLRYTYRNLGYSLADYLERQRVTGLLVLQRGAVVAEHYRYGRKEDARFLSFSMAKSVTALLVGIAVDRGLIASLDDPASRYVPRLAGTAYGETSIRHLLRMASGIRFSERYDGQDDIARLSRDFAVAPTGTVDVLRTQSERHAAPGTVFRYASAETDVLGRVLAGATGRSLATLTHEWLWEPLGAEHGAFWRIGRDGQEGAFGAFNASLRDWGRLGAMLAQDGRVAGRQLVPEAFLLDATDVARQPDAFRPGTATPTLGYGYQFWLLPLRARTFALQGIHGQAIFVQPASGIVMVHTAVWQHASARQDAQPAHERHALWLGVLRSLGGSVD